MSGIIPSMEIAAVNEMGETYKVLTPVYQGPLDLLLQLIERAELDITSLALAQVTDQFLNYLKKLENKDAEEVSAFLVIAAKLIQIKSEALLPHAPIRELGEEDPGEALAQQLKEYKRYKEIACILKNRDKQGLKTYLRLTTPPKVQSKVDLSHFTVADLFEAAQKAIWEADNRQELGVVVPIPRVTIREKIGMIFNSLVPGKSLTFRTLLTRKNSRLDVVVTFLAMLELIKRHFIRVQQESLFGDITMEVSNGWDEDVDFELEFGE